MQKLYRYDPETKRYLGFVLLLDGCTLASAEDYTDVAPADESQLTDYTWDVATKTWVAVSQAGDSTTTTTSGG